MDKQIPTHSDDRCPICEEQKVVRYALLGLGGISGTCGCHRFNTHLSHFALAGVVALFSTFQAILLYAWAYYELDVTNSSSGSYFHPARLLQVLGFAHLPIAAAFLHTMFRVWHSRSGSVIAVMIATSVLSVMATTRLEPSFDFILPHWGIFQAEYVNPAVSFVGRFTFIFLLGAAWWNAKDGETISHELRGWFKKIGGEKARQ
jgi:hypothetical protein